MLFFYIHPGRTAVISINISVTVKLITHLIFPPFLHIDYFAQHLIALSDSGVFSNGECQDHISELESLLDSQVTFANSYLLNFLYWRNFYWSQQLQTLNCWFYIFIQVYTIEDRVERKEFILMANQNSRLYDPATSSNLELKEELESSRSKVKFLLCEVITDTLEMGKETRKMIWLILWNIMWILVQPLQIMNSLFHQVQLISSEIEKLELNNILIKYSRS